MLYLLSRVRSMSRKILALLCLFAVSIDVNAQFGDFLKNIAEDTVKKVIVGALSKKPDSTSDDSKSGDDDDQKIDSENAETAQNQEGSDKISLKTNTSIVYAHVLGTRISYTGWYDDDVRPILVRFSDINARLHPERKINTTQSSKMVVLVTAPGSGEPASGEPVPKEEVRKRVSEYINNHTNSNERYFEGSWRNEVLNNDWDATTALTNYRDRISTVVSDVERIMGDDLEMWKQHRSGYYYDPYDPDVVKGRLEWICDNIFDDMANSHLKYLAAVTALTEEEFCEETKNYSVTGKTSLLANRLESPFSLDPTRMSDPESGFYATPDYVSEMLVLLGGTIAFNDHTLRSLLESNMTKSDFRVFISLSLSRISFDVVHAAYYGVAPLTSFDTYQTMLREYAQSFLFSNIGSEKDIGARLMSTDLTEEDFSILMRSLSGGALSGKEKKILSFYEKRFENFEIIQKEKAEKNRIEKLNAKEQQYRNDFSHFATVEACNVGRQGYAVQYILDNQMITARERWTQIKDASGFSEEIRLKLEREVMSDGILGLLIKSAAATQYNEDTADRCSFSYSSLTLF